MFEYKVENIMLLLPTQEEIADALEGAIGRYADEGYRVSNITYIPQGSPILIAPNTLGYTILFEREKKVVYDYDGSDLSYSEPQPEGWRNASWRDQL